MMHSASSMNVIDIDSGKMILGMRFSGVPAALNYLSQANLACSSCGKHFNTRSAHTIMNRGNAWEIMFPHNCQPHNDQPQLNRNEKATSEQLRSLTSSSHP